MDVTARAGATRTDDRTVTPANRTGDIALGRAIRAARRERGLTLREVAAAAGLSQPFLSQLELGRARPSMRSLWAVAEALGTTQQALLAASAPGGEAPAVAGERAGVSHLLLHDPDGVDVTEFAGVSETWGEFFTHGRRELLYVVRGRFEVELDEPSGRRRVVLGERDSLSYAGATPHRFRRADTPDGVLLMIHSDGGA